MIEINVNELENLSATFGFLSALTDFPEQKLSMAAVPKSSEKAAIERIVRELEALELQKLQEKYISLFELNKNLTLYMTYYKMTDSRERGTVLAKLKMLYEMFGVSLDMAELTDYLPAMLEFLSVGEFSGDARLEDLGLFFSILEDGTYELLQRAGEFEDEAYIHLIRVVRKLLKRCVRESTASCAGNFQEMNETMQYNLSEVNNG